MRPGHGTSATALALIALLAAGASAGCLGGNHECSEGEYRCTATGVDTCDVSHEFGGGSFWLAGEQCEDGTQCVPGAFVCAYGPAPDPRCPTTPVGCHGDSYGCGAYSPACDGATILHCEGGYLTGTATCPAGTTCVLKNPPPAICAASATPDPRCIWPGESYYCEGDDIVKCQDGYRVAHAACGTGDSSAEVSFAKSADRTHCVETTTSALCVPPSAQPTAVCEPPLSPFQTVCDGTALTRCESGYPVRRTVCRTCSIQKDAYDAWTQECAGRLGWSCSTAQDCADGFGCLVVGGESKCSVPCTSDAECTAAASGGPLPSGYPVRCIGRVCG